MEFDPDRVRDNIRRAETSDLLDRVTVYRADLEPEALTLMMEELRARKITPEQIVLHEQSRQEALTDDSGLVRACSFCRNPAIAEGKGWFRLFRLVPLVPRTLYFCSEHVPAEKT
ncbi:hypothetical protein [Zavarzinella formosa]|uniref:hypothetical protein n=1 Tax=Zavarzinella formosa TaxID=360055 RepID=UPI0002D5A5C0|nr:hypothetical protein [Zavarzinella formosa]